MAQLEQALGSRLLGSAPRAAFQLTEAGQLAFQHSQAMLERPRRCWIARRASGRAQRRCGWPCQGIWPAGDPPADAGILARYPEVDVQLLLDDHARDPISDEVDLVVLATDRPPPGLVARPLMPVAQLAVRLAHIWPDAASRPSRRRCKTMIACFWEKHRTIAWEFARDGQRQRCGCPGAISSTTATSAATRCCAGLGIYQPAAVCRRR